MKQEKIKLSLSLFNNIVSESLKGKGIGRILMNFALNKVEISGKIIDLGAGTPKASYNRFLRFKKPFNVTYTDFYEEGENLVKLNLEEKYSLPDDNFDNILCFNALEHVYNYQNVVTESYRILKDGGTFIGATPFICSYHPSPNDFFRYSKDAIDKIFSKVGFKMEKMVYLGFGPFTASFSQWGNLIPNNFFLKIIKLVLLIPHIALDLLLNLITKRFQNNYPLGYLYIFKK